MVGKLDMNIFVYSDESGVFDKIHNKIFVFGGAIFLSANERDNWNRKYIAAEKSIRSSENIEREAEVKASNVSNKSKGKLYRSLNAVHKFGVVIDESRVLDNIFDSKKSKQMYLDYAYKIGVKRKFEDLIARNLIDPQKVDNLYFSVDEHTTATDGRYELKEALEQEFKIGTYNYSYSVFYKPIFPNLKTLNMRFCNSQKVTLVRSADIIANKVYFEANKTCNQNIQRESKLLITYLP